MQFVQELLSFLALVAKNLVASNCLHARVCLLIGNLQARL